MYDEDGKEYDPSATEAIDHDGVNAETEGRLWRAGDAIGEGETLDFDSSAYDMLHRMHHEWPCMTFGFVKDALGEQRTSFPMTAFAVAGTQAESADQNRIVCTKLSKLAKTRHDEDSDSDDDDDDDDDDEDPVVEAHLVPYAYGTINRLKLMPQMAHICATWAESGAVHVHNLAAPLSNLAAPGSAGADAVAAAATPLHTFSGHADEGFALDWSSAKQGLLASGDNANKIHLWQPHEGGTWQVEPEAFSGHTDAVEDIAWSPVEPNVMMSVGCDCTVRVWDCRRKSGSAMTVNEGHGQDINVLSWNKLVNYLVVTGGARPASARPRPAAPALRTHARTRHTHVTMPRLRGPRGLTQSECEEFFIYVPQPCW